MSYTFEKGKDKIISLVTDKIRNELKGEQSKLCAQFVDNLLSTVALDDLGAWQIEDLYAAMINYWSLIYHRKNNEQKIRIYNPDFERHGWQTTHTVIEIVHDDMPFLVDSIQMEINRMGLTSHLIIHMGDLIVKRDNNHKITKVFPLNEEVKDKNVSVEAPIFIEINRQTNPDVLNELSANLERVLDDNRAVVADWPKMRERVRNAISELDEYASFVDKDDLEESKYFLKWIEDHHFTFLGLREYSLKKDKNETILKAVSGTGLGVLNDGNTPLSCRSVSAMTPEARASILSSQILVISKTNTQSTVHRPIYTDYIGIKQFDKKGKVSGELRVIGLYTSVAYNTSPKRIPVLRLKVKRVMNMSRLGPHSHAGKVLQNILDTLPRDDLFQASAEKLLEIGMGIFHMQERRQIRMFARKDIYGRFISCLVYVPKELFNTQLRSEMQAALCKEFSAIESTFSTRFSDSVLARIHFMIKINPLDDVEYDFKEMEQIIIAIGRNWVDDLYDGLLEVYGEELANKLHNKYQQAFPAAYKEQFSARTAIADIKHMNSLCENRPMTMNFYRPVGELSDMLRLKVYNHSDTIALSDVVPILENMGLRVINERPYVLKLKNKSNIWINEFGMLYPNSQLVDVDYIKERYQDAFAAIWFNQAENDGFNQLVLGASLDWREVSILRAYAKYFKQIKFTFSQEYIVDALTNNTKIAQNLVKLFHTRFAIDENKERMAQAQAIKEEILKCLDEVTNLDEDKILRRYIDVIEATLRTNFYQLNENGCPKRYLSLKFDLSVIPELPLPKPMYEIFVYSPSFEGVHLRAGKVARGGLRWSDRREDFRTEVLGLMKAQQVKNSVIVPSGAKGGFVPKNLPVNGSREDIMAEGIACYKMFIRGLLDITDNYDEEKIIKPDNVYCFDGDDPYLVVAADKGTATFSDIANEIATSFGFWLGDAFASGGSIGYDHKKMGITAKGAWESVKRHFRELGKNIQKTDCTVVGIGDMAGDVFGNGMLLSKHICLVGAFNHMHIFIDPTPNAAAAYEERARLFNLPRSAWTDFDESLISKGGGVFSRLAKSIALTPEIKKAFGLEQNSIEPNDLIRAMLKSQVDLLWSGGIGTFVKAEAETHGDADDRTNDLIRVNANQLRCKVVGEGGNLGLTQLARIEYAMQGGLIYTDFIDNSAGVDCSDNEVNIKILLNGIVNNGDMTDKQRNALLAEMTDEVSDIVLNDNYQQTQAISLAAFQAARNVELHGRYIAYLEQSGKLDRDLEFIPDEKSLMEQKLNGQGMLRPGIAVLLCYSKILINEQILDSTVPEDPYLASILIEAFPKPLRDKYAYAMSDHKLRREIISTKLSNLIVNEMGFTFAYRLHDETGAETSAIVRAYVIARTIFDLPKRWQEIQALDNKANATVQMEMMVQYVRLLRRSTRWFLRSNRMNLDIASTVELYGPGIERLKKVIPTILSVKQKARLDTHISDLKEKGVPAKLAKEVAISHCCFSALDIIESANELDISIETVTRTYFGLGEFLDLNWLRNKIIIHPTENHWESLSREALRDDIDWQQKQLTIGFIETQDKRATLENTLEQWSEQYTVLIERWRYILADLRSATMLNYTMFFVAIRELLDLTQTTMQQSQHSKSKD